MNRSNPDGGADVEDNTYQNAAQGNAYFLNNVPSLLGPDNPSAPDDSYSGGLFELDIAPNTPGGNYFGTATLGLYGGQHRRRCELRQHWKLLHLNRFRDRGNAGARRLRASHNWGLVFWAARRALTKARQISALTLETGATLRSMKNDKREADQTYSAVSRRKRGTGPDSAGQSGDTQGLSRVEEAGPEGVEELLEEGQSMEAEAIGGVQDAPDADVAEVHTRQVPADDVPLEYQQPD